MTRALAGLRLAGRAIERAAPGRPGVGWDSALGAGRHDSADGFATVALVLRASLDHGDWPERLSYD